METMDDNLTHYCENVIRSPLPIFLRRTFMYVTFIIYFIAQTYTCCQLSKWRMSKNQLKGNGSEVSDSAKFNTILTSQNFTNVTTSASNFTVFVYEMKTSNISTNLTAEGTASPVEEIPPLYGHAIAIPLMMFAFQICLFVCRVRYQSVYACAVQYVNLIDIKDVIHCKQMRGDYARKGGKLSYYDEKTLKSVLTIKEQSSCYAMWRTLTFWKPTVSFISISYPSIDCTLVDYMFSHLRYEGGYQIIGAIELIYEIMKGMDYLHYRNVYHLDLRPESVKLHCNGRKVYVKLTNFNFMKKCMDKKISSTSVGLRGFYRPLECSVEQEVDSEKCDIWGLGMISLDLFTGGLYRIKSESGEWDEQRYEELISTFTQSSSFTSYLDGAYGVVDMFTHSRFLSSCAYEMRWTREQVGFAIVTEYPYKSYNVCHTNFLYNIRCFVCRLLIFSPRRRITLERAFEQPMILNREFTRRK